MHVLVRTTCSKLHVLDPDVEEAKLTDNGYDADEQEGKMSVKASTGEASLSVKPDGTGEVPRTPRLTDGRPRCKSDPCLYDMHSSMVMRRRTCFNRRTTSGCDQRPGSQ